VFLIDDTYITDQKINTFMIQPVSLLNYIKHDSGHAIEYGIAVGEGSWEGIKGPLFCLQAPYETIALPLSLISHHRCRIYFCRTKTT